MSLFSTLLSLLLALPVWRGLTLTGNAEAKSGQPEAGKHEEAHDHAERNEKREQQCTPRRGKACRTSITTHCTVSLAACVWPHWSVFSSFPVSIAVFPQPVPVPAISPACAAVPMHTRVVRVDGLYNVQLWVSGTPPQRSSHDRGNQQRAMDLRSALGACVGVTNVILHGHACVVCIACLLIRSWWSACVSEPGRVEQPRVDPVVHLRDQRRAAHHGTPGGLQQLRGADGDKAKHDTRRRSHHDE